jgi:hypothetical protein
MIRSRSVAVGAPRGSQICRTLVPSEPVSSSSFLIKKPLILTDLLMPQGISEYIEQSEFRCLTTSRSLAARKCLRNGSLKLP